ncbi:MAG: class I SAM-dependent methyltransferase [Polaromonas sp.]
MSVVHDYTGHWDEKFSSRAWGRYPPEDLVRFMGRRFRDADRKLVRVLEVGCGPGANIWFLHREGYAVHGIDISQTAIDLAAARLATENIGLHSPAADLRVGNFSNLPWPEAHFDVVVDVFALYANTLDVISQALSEIDRVLKSGGLLYTKLWGTHTTGFGQGLALEPGTFDAIRTGPCASMGVTHFFTREEIKTVFGKFFQPIAVDLVLREDSTATQQIEEFHCQFVKRAR